METTPETKREKVINLFNDTGYDFYEALNKTSDNNIEILYNLLVNDVEPIESEIDVELAKMIGQYYHYTYNNEIECDNKKYRKLCEKYYLLAISKGSKECIFELAYFYHHTFMSNTTKAAKYYSKFSKLLTV
jgi:TPR repeat protein